MARTPSSDPEQRELGEFQGLIERNSNFRTQAFDHNLGRNVRVAKVLTIVRMLRAAHKPLKGSVTCTKAEMQNFSSDQTMTILGLPAGPTQAAHFLPGTLCIGGTPLWGYISDAKFKGKVEFLFGEVEHLPAVFNQADTSAEASGTAGGLCAALAMACAAIIEPSHGNDAAHLMKSAWEQWSNGALIGLRTAIAGKSEKGVIPPLVKDSEGNITPESLDARDNASMSESNRDQAVRILGYYIEDQEQRDWNWVAGPCRPRIAEIESAFRV